MQIIDSSDIAGLEVKVRGLKKTTTPCVVELNKALGILGVGSGIKLLNEEWTLKSDPSSSISNYVRKNRLNKSFTSGRLVNGTGWVITRVR
jgi:hypothetical protein